MMLDYGCVSTADLIGEQIVCSQCGATAHYPATNEGADAATFLGGYYKIAGRVFCLVCAREYDARKQAQREQQRKAKDEADWRGFVADVRKTVSKNGKLSVLDVKDTRLTCSRCGTRECLTHAGLAEFVRKGWAKRNGRVYCPRCLKLQRQAKKSSAKKQEKTLDSGNPAVIIRVVKDKPMTANLCGERKMPNGNGNGRKKLVTRVTELRDRLVAQRAALKENGGRAVVTQEDLAELVEINKYLQVINDAKKEAFTVVTAMASEGAVIEAGALSIQKQEEAGNRSWPNIVKEEYGQEKYKELLEKHKPAPAMRWRVVDALTGKRVDD